MPSQKSDQNSSLEEAGVSVPKKPGVIRRAGGVVVKDLSTTIDKSLGYTTAIKRFRGFGSIASEVFLNRKPKGPSLEQFQDIEVHYGLQFADFIVTYANYRRSAISCAIVLSLDFLALMWAAWRYDIGNLLVGSMMGAVIMMSFARYGYYCFQIRRRKLLPFSMYVKQRQSWWPRPWPTDRDRKDWDKRVSGTR